MQSIFAPDGALLGHTTLSWPSHEERVTLHAREGRVRLQRAASGWTLVDGAHLLGQLPAYVFAPAGNVVAFPR
jgi:hypothetical protein